MKISDLIAKLEEVKRARGDVDVFAWPKHIYPEFHRKEGQPINELLEETGVVVRRHPHGGPTSVYVAVIEG